MTGDILGQLDSIIPNAIGGGISLNLSTMLTQSGCALMQSDVPLTQAGPRIVEARIMGAIVFLG
jgi:hypothetical protein